MPPAFVSHPLGGLLKAAEAEDMNADDIARFSQGAVPGPAMPTKTGTAGV